MHPFSISTLWNSTRELSTRLANSNPVGFPQPAPGLSHAVTLFAPSCSKRNACLPSHVPMSSTDFPASEGTPQASMLSFTWPHVFTTIPADIPMGIVCHHWIEAISASSRSVKLRNLILPNFVISLDVAGFLLRSCWFLSTTMISCPIIQRPTSVGFSHSLRRFSEKILLCSKHRCLLSNNPSLS